MTYPCSCGLQAGSDGRKYLKTERCMKRRYKCLCGAMIHTKEFIAPAGKQGRPKRVRYQG
jgi:hypothetical protein